MLRQLSHFPSIILLKHHLGICELLNNVSRINLINWCHDPRFIFHHYALTWPGRTWCLYFLVLSCWTPTVCTLTAGTAHVAINCWTTYYHTHAVMGFRKYCHLNRVSLNTSCNPWISRDLSQPKFGQQNEDGASRDAWGHYDSRELLLQRNMWTKTKVAVKINSSAIVWIVVQFADRRPWIANRIALCLAIHSPTVYYIVPRCVLQARYSIYCSLPDPELHSGQENGGERLSFTRVITKTS